MNYVGNFAKYINQTRICQWGINKVRENVYPWVYNKWEADRILDDENVWLGSLESACDREALRNLGIERIICAVYDMNPIFPHDPELMYLKVPVIDKPTANIAKHFDRAIEFIDESIKLRKGVLIHCAFGISRSSTLVCAYLIKKHGMSVNAAIAHVKARRPKANPNSGFLLQLQTIPTHKPNDFYGFANLPDMPDL
jgi:protein phosphatase slingshot